MSRQTILRWLHQSFEVDKESQISAEEINNNFFEEFGTTSPHEVGRCLVHAFPSVRRCRKRVKGQWEKYHTDYVGIQKRQNTHRDITFNKITEVVPPDFFVIEKTADYVKLGKSTGCQCNGNTVYMEIKIFQSGHVQTSQGQKLIDTTMDYVQMNTQSLSVLFATLQCLVFCNGVPSETVRSDSKENCIIQLNAEKKSTAFSVECSRVLKFAAPGLYGKVCSKCHQLRATTCNPQNQVSATSQQTENTTNELHLNQNSASSLGLKTNTVQQENTTENSEILNTPCSRGNLQSIPTERIICQLKAEAPYLSPKQLDLFRAQLDNSNKTDPRGRRWDPNIIQMCLSIWTRSPRAYEQLALNGSLVFPSTVTLSRYKNSVKQSAGINEEMLKWMALEAKHENLPTHGYSGGLLFDEMSIQPDLQILKRGGESKLVGFTELGPEADSMASHTRTELANHVLQFMFHGLTGFRFLVAHYPTNQANSAQLFSIFWDVVQALTRWGFSVIYTCMDGASNNRAFIKMHFSPSSTPADFHMKVLNPFSGADILFLADPSHVFKKIRNSILKSGQEPWHTRLLTHNNSLITWKLFVGAYEWDRGNSLAIHHKLTHEHLHPNQADKMRNHLAEEVLDASMLHLLKCFQEHLGANGTTLQGAISLLEQTSVLIRIFRDSRPVRDTADERLLELEQIQTWFKQWASGTQPRGLLSSETMEDIQFLISGFIKLAKTVTSQKQLVVPKYVNSDILENIFSQQRGLHHGAGTNPNYLNYCQATNSITLCQSIISKNSNSSRRKSTTSKGALPLKQLAKEFRL